MSIFHRNPLSKSYYCIVSLRYINVFIMFIDVSNMIFIDDNIQIKTIALTLSIKDSLKKNGKGLL